MISSLRHVKEITYSYKIPNRSIYFVLQAFNRVDKDRIQEIGPDGACAEWLLRNGAAVRWKGSTEYSNNFNEFVRTLPKFYIEAVDATESGIHEIGFPYFGGCKYLTEMKLNKCVYVDDKALQKLSVTKESLKTLEIKDNRNITENGLFNLKVLQKLEKLELMNIKHVKDKKRVYEELQKALPNCKIEVQ